MRIGTPPPRIYRSFVCPRKGKNHIPETVDRAAKRTAAQIALAMRQVRADQAVYLRNNDRSAILAGSRSSSSIVESSHSQFQSDSDSETDTDSDMKNISKSGDSRLGKEKEEEEGGKVQNSQNRPIVIHPVALVLDNVRSAFNGTYT